MYDIQVSGSTGLVQATLGGLMSVDEVADYIRDLKAAFIQHKLRSYALILDVSDCPIQNQDMLRAMGEHMAGMPKARSIAIVTGSSLARMQVRRLFKQPYARITATLQEGRAWVLEGVEPAGTPLEAATATR